MANMFTSKVQSSILSMLCFFLVCGVAVNAQDGTVRIRTLAVTGNLPNPTQRGLLLGLNIQAGTEFFCGGTNINVPFIVEYDGNGRLLSDNVFRAEISRNDGTFPETPDPSRTFGSVAGRTSGTIYAQLPPNLPFGTNYRVRVIATRPRLATRLEFIPNQTDSTRNYNLAVIPKPCFSATTKAVDCRSTLNVRINTSCSFGRCDCPGTDPNIPILNQQYYQVELVDYPLQPGELTFNYNEFSYTFSNLPTGWYNVRVRDIFGCDSTINYFHVSSPARPISTITIDNVTDRSVFVSWTDVNSSVPNTAGTSYDLRYRVVEDNQPTSTEPGFPDPNAHANWTQVNNIGAANLFLDNLQPNTRYEVQIRNVCFSPVYGYNISPWSAAKYFDTRQIPTPQPSQCRAPGGIYVRYTNLPDPRGLLFFNTDPNNFTSVPGSSSPANNQPACFVVEYGPVFSSDDDPQRVALDWSHPSYIRLPFVYPAQAIAGIPLNYNTSWREDQQLRVRVRANCSLRCAATQQTLSDWSRTVLFNLPSPRIGDVLDTDGRVVFSVYPNPNNGQFSVNLVTAEEGIANVIVRDIMGKVVKTTDVSTVAGPNNFQVDLTSFGAGIYLLQVNQNGTTNTVRIVVK
jgi:hypothetical protein